MFHFETTHIPAPGVRSLCWRGDTLVDWAAGGAAYHLDGTKAPGRYFYAYRFDAAVTSPSQHYTVLYQRLGTKGLLLDAGGRLVRELNRTYYHAHVYEYPIVLFALPDGREALAHCPEKFNRIEIELADTGERLTRRDPGAPAADFFHSRLAVNTGETRLLSAGWIWHPVEAARVFDLRAALLDPATLDAKGDDLRWNTDVSSAAFASDNTLFVASPRDGDVWDEEADGGVLNPGMIGAYDLAVGRYLSLAPLEDEAGTLMPVGPGHAIGFFEHPKLLEVATGKVVHRWPELKTGRQNGSIIHHLPPVPPLAVDPARARFAVASEPEITVVTVRRA